MKELFELFESHIRITEAAKVAQRLHSEAVLRYIKETQLATCTPRRLYPPCPCQKDFRVMQE